MQGGSRSPLTHTHAHISLIPHHSILLVSTVSDDITLGSPEAR